MVNKVNTIGRIGSIQEKDIGISLKNTEEIKKFLLEILNNENFKQEIKYLNNSHLQELLNKKRSSNTLEEVSEEVIIKLIEIIENDNFGKFTENKINYDGGNQLNLEQFFSNKKLKKEFNKIFKKFGLTDNQIVPFVDFFRQEIIKKGSKTFVENYNTLSEDKRKYLYLEHYNLGNLSKKDKVKIARKIENLSAENLLNFLKLIEKIDFSNPIKTQEKESNKISKRLKENLIYFILEKIENNGENLKIENLEKLINIFSEITSNNNFNIYLSKLDNDKVLLERIFNIIQNNKVILKTVTCPDYSGEIIEENGTKSFSYNFNSLNTGCGIVAEKGFDFVKNMYYILSKYISNVKIEHSLPTFEFYQSEEENGFKGKEKKYSYEECKNILGESCNYIKEKYSTNGLNANVVTTDETIIKDNELREKQKIIIKNIQNDIENENSKFRELITNIYRRRFKLYENWYPKEKEESNENYQKRIFDIIIGQIAEYIVFSTAMLEDENSFALMSDSVIMQEIYTIIGLPALYGIGKNILDYKGA